MLKFARKLSTRIAINVRKNHGKIRNREVIAVKTPKGFGRLRDFRNK